jgi:hypothetical protein
MGGTREISRHGRRRAPGPQEAPDDEIQTGEDHARTAMYALALHGDFADISDGVNHLKTWPQANTACAISSRKRRKILLTGGITCELQQENTLFQPPG